MKNKIRVFSATRPTGHLHLGNYFGAIKGYLDLQNDKNLDCIYGVVDLHGITSPYDPKTYPENIKDLVLDYLACGLNPKKSHLIIQSQIPEHVELAYYLATIYPVSRLEQLPTYKDKKKNQPQYVNLGLLSYPILMAADILIYKAKLVPVGKDQLPHLELTREVVRAFNRYFGETFEEPQPYLTNSPYVPSLKGEGKMSKTDPDSYISIIDDKEIIRKKIFKVPTDSGHNNALPQEGGVNTLLILVELFEGKKQRELYEQQYLTTGLKYQPLKEKLTEAIYQALEPIQQKRKYYEKRPELINAFLKESKIYAQKIAQDTIKEVKQKMGFPIKKIF